MSISEQHWVLGDCSWQGKYSDIVLPQKLYHKEATARRKAQALTKLPMLSLYTACCPYHLSLMSPVAWCTIPAQQTYHVYLPVCHHWNPAHLSQKRPAA